MQALQTAMDAYSAQHKQHKTGWCPRACVGWHMTAAAGRVQLTCVQALNDGCCLLEVSHAQGAHQVRVQDPCLEGDLIPRPLGGRGIRMRQVLKQPPLGFGLFEATGTQMLGVPGLETLGLKVGLTLTAAVGTGGGERVSCLSGSRVGGSPVGLSPS